MRDQRVLRLCMLLLWLVAGTFGSTALAAPDRQAIRETVQRIGLRKAALVPGFVKQHKTSYSVQVPTTPIGDQEHSGRCWAFAWTKTLETMAIAKTGSTDQLSPAFINYHALRTLAHGAIDQARRTADHPEFNLYHLDADMLGEGGYSHWANALVKKHGIVPESRMPSGAFDSRESGLLQNHLHRLVAAAFRDLDRLPDGATKRRREVASQYKAKVDEALKTMIGVPPARFSIDGKSYTPQTYRRDHLKLADQDLQFVNLTNDPGRAWNRRYREQYAGKGIPENQTYNVKIDTLKKAVVRTLRDGAAVNVAVNVDWDNPHRVADRVDAASKENGILSLKAFQYEKLLPTGKLSKRDRMAHGVSLSNHMMAITGYEPAHRGTRARWKIDNSHGRRSFRKGRFDMDDPYFNHYVEEVTVPRSALPKALLQKLEKAPALDSVPGMSIPPSRGGDRWTPTRKRMLVKSLISQDLTFAEAAQRYGLRPATVKRWYEVAKKGMLRAFDEDARRRPARSR